MSDRLAVFNDGRIEQLGRAGGCLRAAGDAVRRRLRRDLEPAHRGGGPGDRSARTARSRSGPRRSAWPSPTNRAGPTRSRPTAAIRDVVVPRPGHALSRGARRGRRAHRHPAEPEHLEHGGARSRRVRRSGSSGSGRHALAVADGGARWRRDWHEIRTDPGPCRLGRDRRGRRAADPAPRAAPTPARVASAPAKAARLSVLSWPGYAENGSDRPGVRLGEALRGRDRLQDQPSRCSARPTRRSSCSPATPSNTTSSRRPATQAGASSRGGVRPAGQRGSAEHTTRTSSRHSRTRRGTRSTASTTASRTAGAPIS